MKKKFNLTKLKKLHVLSSVELTCLKGGKKKGKPLACPPDM